jgi:hypothetical protein
LVNRSTFKPLKNIFMNQFIALLTVFFITTTVKSLDKKSAINIPGTTGEIIIAEAACGQCRFGMPGKSCDLAVRINGKAYFVDGTNIDDHGDAHAKDGFCEAVRIAEVQGTVEDGRFKASYFKLHPGAKKKSRL